MIFLLLMLLLTGLFDGLLLSTILARLSFKLLGPDKVAQLEHQNVGKNLEAGHVFLQWKTQLRAYHHGAE